MKRWMVLVMFMAIALTLTGITGVSAREEENSDTFTLEEVTVTATKVPENQQNIDIAMEVLAGETLKEMGRTDIDDILSSVSTAIIARAADGLRVSLRGLSDDDKDFMDMSQSAPMVAVNMDGVRSNRKDKGSTLFDVQRVEVLYGPQSTLYSSNSPGGIVNIVTSQPKLDTYEASGTLEYGNYDLLRTEGAVNFPLTDKIAVRTAFTTEVRDGYYSNGADNADSKAVRLRALIQPMEDLSLTMTVQHTRRGGNGLSSNVDAFVTPDDVDDPWETSSSSTADPGGRDQRNTEYNAQLDWSTDYGTVTVIPSYSEGNIDSKRSDPIFGNSFQLRESEEKGAEVRMASDPDFFFQWIVGYNYYEQEDFNYRGREESEQFSDRKIYEEAHSIFANIAYPVTDKMRLVAGYRRSWDDMYTRNIELKPGAPVPGTTERPMQEFDEERTMEYSNPDYKVGFEYDLAEQSMVYGNYSTSYRVRGWGGRGTDITPEELKAYTIGSKNRFLDNRLQVNLSAYYYDYTNYSANQSVSVWFDLDGDGVLKRSETTPDPNGSQYGTGRNWGTDLQINAIITPQDILNVSWSYINSEWTDLYFDYYYDFTDALDDDGNVIQVPIEDRNYNGKPLTNSPPHTISASYSHNFVLPNGASIRARLNSRYQTDYRLSWKDEEYPLNWQEAYHLTDASLVYTNPDNKFSLSLWVKNIEDYAVKRMFRSALTGPGQVHHVSIGTPRTVGATLSVNF